ncbi:hypothetical protein Taro_003037 [Colocasia esculenta]|uniref:Transmembrane protein n=1 Tax=Colocasia esculenta TaxID=4460 RepID=A0A843TQL2_COLES|nr:hypothetical protein [Colocasia esculenta]
MAIPALLHCRVVCFCVVGVPAALAGRDSLSQEFVAGRSWWRWLAFQQGPSVLLLLLGARAVSKVVVFACAAVGFVVNLRVHVLALLAAPSCWSVSLLDVPFLLGSLQHLFVVVVGLVLTGCELCESSSPSGTAFVVVEVIHCVASLVEVSVVWLVVVALTSRLRCIAWLSCVLVQFPRTVGCYPGEFRYQDYFGLNETLVVLVEVLPEQVVLLLLSSVFSLLAMRFGHLVGLCSGDGSKNGSWRFGRRFFPSCFVFVLVVAALSHRGDELSLLPVGLSVLQSASALSVEVWCPCRGAGQVVFQFIFKFSWLHCLVSAMGVWLVVLLWKCQSRLVVSLGVWKRLIHRGCSAGYASYGSASLVLLFPMLLMGCLGWWSFHMEFDAMSRTVATFVAKVPPLLSYFEVEQVASPRLCLEALVAVWCVALSACGGRSGASCCELLRASMVVALLKLLVVGVVVYCTWSVFLFRCLLWRVIPVSRVVLAVVATMLHLAEFWCFWWHPVLVLEWFIFVPSGALVHCVPLWVAPGSPIGGAPGFRRGLCPVGVPYFDLDPPEVDVLSSTSIDLLIPVRFADILGCLALPTSDTFSGFASVRVLLVPMF